MEAITSIVTGVMSVIVNSISGNTGLAFGLIAGLGALVAVVLLFKGSSDSSPRRPHH